MRIAFCHHLSMGYNAGGEQEIAQVAIRLAARGHEVTVYSLPFALGKKSISSPKTLLKGVRYEEAWFHRISSDVSYVTYHPFCLLNFRIDSPKVAGFHSQVWFQKPSFAYGSVPMLAKLLYDLLGRPELSQFDAIHLHDAYLKGAFRFLRKPLFDIPHPVNLEVFRPHTGKNSRFTVMYCGRPTWAKGFDEFLGLARDLENEDMQFVWLGGGERHPHVTSLGFIQDPLKVADAMNMAHVVVMPQRVDSLGRSTIEALAVGTPVILRAKPESVPSFHSLILAETNDKFRAKILELKHLWETERYPGSYSASDFAPERFSIDAVTDAYEEMFCSLV